MGAGDGIAHIQGIQTPTILGPGEPFEIAISVKNIGLIDAIYVTIYEGDTILSEWSEQMNPGETETFPLFFPEGTTDTLILTVEVGHSFEPCDEITNQLQCETAGCAWYNGSCHAGYACSLINNQADCDRFLCYWYNGECYDCMSLCQWLRDQGLEELSDLPTLDISLTSVFTLIDHYLFQTTPEGYYFIPTLSDIFGTIDYYLGFNGDPLTGCDFYP